MKVDSYTLGVGLAASMGTFLYVSDISFVDLDLGV